MPYSWYAFDAAADMRTGWYADETGSRYYLNPEAGMRCGEMLTGWQKIDGSWYYFKREFNTEMGRLLVNGVTPDGYRVDANGAWIE